MAGWVLHDRRCDFFWTPTCCMSWGHTTLSKLPIPALEDPSGSSKIPVRRVQGIFQVALGPNSGLRAPSLRLFQVVPASSRWKMGQEWVSIV